MLAYCKQREIRLTDPAIGKPPKDQTLTKQAKKEEYHDICGRNEVECVFETGKTAYRLEHIAAHIEATTFCAIGVALTLMNLTKRLRSFWLFILIRLWWADYSSVSAAV